MTDEPQDASDFSFRTFDIYREFVEVLQCNPDYLEEFKNGSPKEQTSLAIIERVFQSDQKEEEIKKYMQYFANHAKMMAGHAENLPDNWKEAIDYTDKYIKAIHNYLRRKRISVKTGMKSVDKIARDLAKHLHDRPSLRQIEAIRYYLKYDLTNPKRSTIDSSSQKNINEHKNQSKNVEEWETVNNIVVEEPKNIYVQKKNDEKTTASESIEEITNFLQMSNKNNKNSNNDGSMDVAAYEYIETIPILNDPLEQTEQEYQLYTDQRNETTELNSSYCYNAETNNIFQTKQVQEIGMIEQASEKDPAHSLLTELENGNDDEYPNQNVSLKRKSSTLLENHNYCSLKKPLQIWCRIPNNVHQKCYTESAEGCADSDTFWTMENVGMLNENETNNQLQGSIFNLRSQVKNMNYTAALKCMDLVTTFCELKNATSQEELHTMQQIRDKIYFKSLDEQRAV